MFICDALLNGCTTIRVLFINSVQWKTRLRHTWSNLEHFNNFFLFYGYIVNNSTTFLFVGNRNFHGYQRMKRVLWMLRKEKFMSLREHVEAWVHKNINISDSKHKRVLTNYWQNFCFHFFFCHMLRNQWIGTGPPDICEPWKLYYLLDEYFDLYENFSSTTKESMTKWMTKLD